MKFTVKVSDTSKPTIVNSKKIQNEDKMHHQQRAETENEIDMEVSVEFRIIINSYHISNRNQ